MYMKGYGTSLLSLKSHRQGMVPHRPAAAEGEQARSPAYVFLARHSQCHFLRAADRLPVAVLTSRLPEVENCLSFLSFLLALAQRENVGTDPYPLTRAPP